MLLSNEKYIQIWHHFRKFQVLKMKSEVEKNAVFFPILFCPCVAMVTKIWVQMAFSVRQLPWENFGQVPFLSH